VTVNLRHIEVFHALMRAASMTEAARRLGVSQPAISTVLKHAEQRLGMKLFQRAGGRLIPTPEAISLFPDVDQIFTRIEALNRSAQGLRDAASGVLSVAATPTLANVVLPPAIAAFTAERPQVRVIVQGRPTNQIITGVRDRTCDLGLIYEPAGPMDEDIAAESVGTFRLACVMPRSHPLAAQAVIGPVDLAEEPLITFGLQTPLGARLATVFREAGVPLTIRIESSASSTSVFLVAAGAGVAVVDSAGTLGDSFPMLTVRDFEPRIECRVLLLHGRDRQRSRLADSFARQLAESVQASHAPAPEQRLTGA
jgi:DNA-binding transcriptional LysR family regulator